LLRGRVVELGAVALPALRQCLALPPSAGESVGTRSKARRHPGKGLRRAGCAGKLRDPEALGLRLGPCAGLILRQCNVQQEEIAKPAALVGLAIRSLALRARQSLCEHLNRAPACGVCFGGASLLAMYDGEIEQAHSDIRVVGAEIAFQDGKAAPVQR